MIHLLDGDASEIAASIAIAPVCQCYGRLSWWL